jgi:hypothetical protein
MKAISCNDWPVGLARNNPGIQLNAEPCSRSTDTSMSEGNPGGSLSAVKGQQK